MELRTVARSVVLLLSRKIRFTFLRQHRQNAIFSLELHNSQMMLALILTTTLAINRQHFVLILGSNDAKIEKKTYLVASNQSITLSNVLILNNYKLYLEYRGVGLRRLHDLAPSLPQPSKVLLL